MMSHQELVNCSLCEASDLTGKEKYSYSIMQIYLYYKYNFVFAIDKINRHRMAIYTSSIRIVKVKGKAIPLQAWTGPEGSRRMRLPDFMTIGT